LARNVSGGGKGTFYRRRRFSGSRLTRRDGIFLMSTLNRAIAIAAEAHSDQEKAGELYILHPLRVMMDLVTNEERIVGVLHDVVEKSPAWPMSTLKAEGFSQEILAAIDSVTRREDEDYEAFVLRAGQNELGRRVKLADLADNLRISRSAPPSDKMRKKIAKQEKAQATLLAWPPESGIASRTV
jgi:(p)ppGpp synthase/HD superfamily hydrolase